MLSLLGTTAESADRRDTVMSLWSDDGASESLHESWKTSRLYSALEKMLSLNSESSPPQTSGKRSRADSASISSSEWGLRVDQSHSTPRLDAPRVVEPSASPCLKRSRLSLPTDGRAASQPPSNGLNTLQLPPQTSHLLDVYFAATHSWFPIVAKHNILRASYLYANSPLSVTNVSPGSGDHAALWAILSYTVSQSRTIQLDGPSGLLAKTKGYYSIARSLIPSENGHYELGHVQALLLLTLVNIGLEEWTAAWLMSGKAVRMAISMDLGTLTDTQRSEELRQGKATFLGCFVVDSLLSFRLSRRPCMHPRDLSPVGLLEEDGLEEWNSWADVLPPTGGAQAKNPPRRGPLLALSCFNRLVELASVLNKIARDCSAGPNSHAFAQQMVLELKQWDDHLPLGCRLIGAESIYPERHSALLPHQTYLGLVYVATLLWLYLRIAPQELGLHHSQRPATEGAKKLLYRALPMISQHLDNFSMCGLPPVFELSLRTITEQAFALRTMIESDSFPFSQWTEALVKRTKELTPTWPAYVTLLTTIERWYRSGSLSEAPSMALHGTMNIPGLSPGPVTMTGNHPQGSTSMRTQANMPGDAKQDLSSSILGIAMPADGQYMTPKDTAMENADLSMTDASSLQQVDTTPTLTDKLALTNGMPPSTHPQPPTPDSSVSNQMRTVPDRSSHSGNVMLKPRPSGSNIGEPQASNGAIDAIFEDLAYLDTTEWANNREAGLKEFGFIDDSTFQAFCHDPDRLVGSQPLIHPPSIADIWPPPGFFPETFQDNSDDRMST